MAGESDRGRTLEDLFDQLAEIKDMVKDVPCIRVSIDEISVVFEEIKQEVIILKKRCEKLEEEKEDLYRRVDRLEGYSRRSNLVFHNVEEEEEEDWSRTENIISDILKHRLEMANQEITIERAHRMGRKGVKPRPIIVKFNKYKDKIKILDQSKKLKGSRIGISEDYTERVREIRAKLKEFLVIARSEGRYAVLRFDKLVIDGRYYTLRDLTDNHEGGAFSEDVSEGGVPGAAKEGKKGSSLNQGGNRTRGQSQEGRSDRCGGNRLKIGEPSAPQEISKGPSSGSVETEGAGRVLQVVGAAEEEKGGKRSSGVRRWLEKGATTRQRAKKAEVQGRKDSQ
jgi:hypothetical protein